MASNTIDSGHTTLNIESDYDLLICGASFAGLAIAWELTRILQRDESTERRVLIIDRYDIGERQTSACAAPTAWIEAFGCERSIRQTFETLTMHTPLGTNEMPLPFTYCTFDYQALCDILSSAAKVQFERATVKGRTGNTVHTDRGDIKAKFIVDCLGWRGILRRHTRQPPHAPLSRGLEVSPRGSSEKMEVWIDRSLVPAGYGWCFPAKDQLRVGIGSFDPRFHVREPTRRLAQRLGVGEGDHQGGWIPHRLDKATEDGVFFVGDSAGQCLPLTAEGIRTAFYFGLACAREIGAVFQGRGDTDRALRRYQAFCDRHEWEFKWMLRVQRLVPRIHPRLLQNGISAAAFEKPCHWAFNHYLKIAHPSYAWKAGNKSVATHKENQKRSTAAIA